MNQKQIGIILIIAGILLASFVFIAKVREDSYIKIVIEAKGSCYLDDGECLHSDRDYTLYILGGVLSLSLVIFGVYLGFIDKTQKVLAEHQVKVSSALEQASKKDEFKAFISGFNKEEQEILSAIKEQEGIKQSTLRFKVGISKTKLSLILKSLEERDIIKRKLSGKSNEVYLRKKF